VVGVKAADRRVNLGLDGGDRVVAYGDLDLVSYDEAGNVVRRKDQVSVPGASTLLPTLFLDAFSFFSVTVTTPSAR